MKKKKKKKKNVIFVFSVFNVFNDISLIVLLFSAIDNDAAHACISGNENTGNVFVFVRALRSFRDILTSIHVTSV